MIRRLWLVAAGLWAGLFLWNGSTKVSGIQSGDILVALAPAVLSIVAWKLICFVILGPRPRYRRG